jgi:hypothetical protein
MRLRSLLVLFRHLTVKVIEKGEIFIREGATERDVYYIKKKYS